VIVARYQESPEITANDGCRLRELIHPGRDESGVCYSLAVARVEIGERTVPHRLTEETEVYYIVAGRGRMHIGDECREVVPRDAIVIPAGRVQWIENLGERPLEFVALVSPPWRSEHDVRT